MFSWGIELFRAHFFAIDFAIGLAAPLAAWLLYRSGRIGRFPWMLFWVGFGLGLTWEAPMQTLNFIGGGWEVHGYVRPAPVPNWVIVIMHSFWDGALFLLGVGLVRLTSGPAYFSRFSAIELAVLLGWGQASELWVELTSTFGEAWYYIAKPLNPALFTFNGQDITLLPQLIWLAAPVGFYFIALKLKPRAQSRD